MILAQKALLTSLSHGKRRNHQYKVPYISMMIVSTFFNVVETSGGFLAEYHLAAATYLTNI